MLKVLFLHNTMAEYRVGFFRELAKLCDLQVCFTDFEIGGRVYGNELVKDAIEGAKVSVLTGNRDKKIEAIVQCIRKCQYDLVILPALDDLFSIRIAKKVLKYCRHDRTKVSLFWEKWRIESQKQPWKRRQREWVHEWLIKTVVRKCDYILYPGYKSKEYYKKLGVKEEQLYKIHDTSEIEHNNDIISTDQINTIKSIPQRKILYLGRLVPVKGIELLITSYSNCSERFKKENCIVLAGDGPLRKAIEEMICSLNLEKRVHLLGKVNPKDREKIYQECDVVVMPSVVDEGRVDAWGMVLNEAIQFQKIIIASTAVGAAFDLIVNGENGFIFEENDSTALRNALENSNTEVMREKTLKVDEELRKAYCYVQMAKDVITPLRK